ncbi:putative phage abortive infection protein [Dysgonomonas alginatilytica]|uniref:Putative phage abortive infection protein n=1 Tax=Dysgonomonas alginatilytica TaxID=1605892 RepID=A0A2V3PMM5_9BACT|nr:putative phage abortive infection protein [Dysgonomonas alginatilytica]PXV61243.1 putative phage abortive infection protein [Dysgonomonas alginatilytica]
MKNIKLILKVLNKYKYPIILVFLILILIAIPWMIKQDLWYCAPINHELFGTYGDFVGGVIGTILAAIAVFYAVKTYLKDKKNAEQGRLRQLQEQQSADIDKLKKKIGNHFYTMLAKHNEYYYYLIENEEDYFSKQIKLFCSILESCEKNLKVKRSKKGVLNLSYLYFFYGEYLQLNTIEESKPKPNVINKMNHYFQSHNIMLEGASKKLAIYFRQLYQIVTYIDNQTILSYDEKYNYIKSLRATLSNEEQYLFFLNSLSTLGDVWESVPNEKNDRLITKYNLIKNIPLNFPRIFGNNDFEDEYSRILYEYNESNEESKRERELWEKDYK